MIEKEMDRIIGYIQSNKQNLDKHIGQVIASKLQYKLDTTLNPMEIMNTIKKQLEPVENKWLKDIKNLPIVESVIDKKLDDYKNDLKIFERLHLYELREAAKELNSLKYKIPFLLLSPKYRSEKEQLKTRLNLQSNKINEYKNKYKEIEKLRDNLKDLVKSEMSLQLHKNMKELTYNLKYILEKNIALDRETYKLAEINNFLELQNKLIPHGINLFNRENDYSLVIHDKNNNQKMIATIPNSKEHFEGVSIFSPAIYVGSGIGSLENLNSKDVSIIRKIDLSINSSIVEKELNKNQKEIYAAEVENGKIINAAKFQRKGTFDDRTPVITEKNGKAVDIPILVTKDFYRKIELNENVMALITPQEYFSFSQGKTVEIGQTRTQEKSHERSTTYAR